MKRKDYRWKVARFILFESIWLVVVFFHGLLYSQGYLRPRTYLSWALMLLIYAGMVVLCVIFYRKVFKPLKTYDELCERFIKGEIYQDYISQVSEYCQITGQTIQRLDQLLDRQNVIQLSTKQAEFLALQNQINPHFLYNTLEAIRGDALCAGMDIIADITEALSTFFRYTITETRDLVVLQDELDNIENYFKIQQYRFGDKLTMDVQLKGDESQLLQIQCPKLTLQPIIENAIFHGVEKVIEKGRINLMVEIVEDQLQINISDNGIGIEEEKLKILNERLERVSVGYVVEDKGYKKGGIALVNVCRRIKLLFGESYGVRVNSIEGIGTKVQIILPILQKGGQK